MEIVCRESAFKHHLTEADIRHAADLWSDATARYDGPVEDFDNKYILIGFDTKANPVEILYNEFGDNGKNVFHAMPCQGMFYHLLKG
ncbi:hypothetical protein FACS1894110_26830 [Spirochaetia bacterium]|nr:hypothetical protein FACS1894110_26830 [Spirochaetia bacterium]